MPGSAAIGNLAVNLTMETAAFSSGASKAQAEMRGLTGAARSLSHGFGSFSASASNMRVVGLELTHITRSLGEQLAMGVSPARAFASEIGRIGTAVQYAGGVGGLGRAIASIVAPFAAAAAGAGVLATAFLGVKQAADSTDLKGYINSLGLTEQQIKKLKDTTVTWGDVAKATFQVLAEKAGTSSGAITGTFSRAFLSIGEFGKFSASVILAAFGAAVKGTADVALKLPALIGGAFNSAVNLGIAALEKLVNGAIDGLNAVSGFVGKFGINLGTVAHVAFQRAGAGISGTLKAIGSDVSSTFHGIFNATEKTFDQISARAVQLRKADLASQAAALKASDAAGKAAKGHEARAKAMKHEADAADGLTKNLDSLMAKEAGFDLPKPKPLAKIDIPDISQPIEKAKSSWQEWADTVPQTAGKISEAFQGIAYRGLDGIASAIGDVISGSRSLKEAFADVAKSIISDLVAMAAKMLIFEAITAIFGGNRSYAQFNDVIASNNAALGVNMPGFANGGSGIFGGFPGVDQNVLSLNGSPIARVSQGEPFTVGNAANSNGRIIVEMRDDMLQARIAEGANIQIVRAAPLLRADAVHAVSEGRRRA